MNTFGYTPQFLTRDGKPWFPFMGEIHYSRLPKDEWREALGKMKSGGVTIASAYAFWIHHEEIEGEYDFSGDRDLRTFLKVCLDTGIYMLLRIGPWCHGEVRNGGFPDWVLAKDFIPRTNDERYFALVEKYYRKLFEQAQGYLHKDGGPIIGVQIENEYGHCGGMNGEAGETHMRRLSDIARNVGFDVPLYTATGWGGAVTGGLLPVMGGYCDAPWDRRLTELEPSTNYVFTHERNDHNIGSELGLGAGLTFDSSLYPFLTAELGGGLQVTRHRRPVATAHDIGAMSLVKLGSGVNLLGYYMYHGGVNPEGKLTTLQESFDTGGYNDLPVKDYNFRAPLGAYGQMTDTFKELKIFGLFAVDFGEEICKMPAYIPNERKPNDLTHLRYSFRHNGQWGYVFINNYIRHYELLDHRDVWLTVPGLEFQLPPIGVESGEYAFYPFNMPVYGGVVRFAEATPLMSINGTTVFYGKPNALLDFEGEPDVLLLSREDALNAYKVKTDTERILICDGLIYNDENGYSILTTNSLTLKCYPAFDSPPQGFSECGNEGRFTLYRYDLPVCKSVSRIIQTDAGEYRVEFEALETDAHDMYLELCYSGESAYVYSEGMLILDDFYSDGRFLIGLKRCGYPRELTVRVEPLKKDTPVYIENWPEIENGEVRKLLSASLTRIDRIPIGF